MDRVFEERPPLLWEPISTEPIEVRLANMRAAIASGADPNELDGTRKPRVGRPLDYAITTLACAYHETVKTNLPIVELLLETGADPRLPGRIPIQDVSPLEGVRRWLEAFDIRGGNWASEETALKPFYESAYKAMKKVADKLDAQDAAERANDYTTEKENELNTGSSWFSWLTFW
ncbi:hypothetical protein P153DRAFT_391922 [Dothidotthia symphoricarpi CBS 119687]|uniref:Ankyrin n=1 Tax=Dothidotthia symphoricarpi CBS 119687 TaxID=1392245 RepID=A0A6A6AS15_9PLEO|nr:uncharacterized protein P153DRAFT_391922 [Dothidotthia symphoricarpi CBS 119687]KAF2134590.1 hypothetical protein P153DRAFT_391922 [Dothidotthia symphoricarpi CBS 119687]